MKTENEIAAELVASIQNGTDVADARCGLYQAALGWAAEEGAVDVTEYASAATARVWALVRAAS